jgi:flagellar biosynthetic protein FliQ
MGIGDPFRCGIVYMTSAFALDWFRDMLFNAVMAGAPPILAALAVGLSMAILQAATQINDSVLAFAPKALAAVVTMAVSAPWILQRLSEFANAAFTAMSRIHP